MPLVTAAGIFALVALLVGGGLLLRRPSWTSAGLFAVLLVSIAGMALSCLGQPKPWEATWPKPKDFAIVGFVLQEPKAIFVWLQTDGPPVAYVLPWSEPQAAALHEAGEAAKAQGTQLKGRPGAQGLPGQANTQDKESIMPYPAPQPPLPLKQS